MTAHLSAYFDPDIQTSMSAFDVKILVNPLCHDGPQFQAQLEFEIIGHGPPGIGYCNLNDGPSKQLRHIHVHLVGNAAITTAQALVRIGKELENGEHGLMPLHPVSN